jgi:uncharacterized membrane protein YcfT
MDTLRGSAIVLVVVAHALAIPFILGFAVPEYLVSLGEFFLPFRMPALMLLSGLLLQKSFAKGLPSYYLGKVQFIVWPYVIWAAVHILQGGVAYSIDEPQAWLATGYLWFLFFLAIYYAIAPLVVRIPSWITPVVFWIIAWLVPEGQLTDFFFYGGFFFTGNVFARHPDVLAGLIRRPWVVVGLAAVATAFGFVSTQIDVNRMPIFAPISLAGIVAAIAVLQRIGGAGVFRPLRFVGRNSLVYYVVHIPVMYLVVGIADQYAEPVPLVGFLLGAALIAGTALAWLRHLPPVVWLFEAPLIGRLRRSLTGRRIAEAEAAR